MSPIRWMMLFLVIYLVLGVIGVAAALIIIHLTRR